MYNEKNLTADFSKWLRKQRWQKKMLDTMAFEFKVCKKNRLNFRSDFQPQQLPMLEEASTGCIYYKLSDTDPRAKPFDSLQICFADSYVGVLWYKYRKPKILYMIPIDKLLPVVDKQKSITEEEAKNLAKITIKL